MLVLKTLYILFIVELFTFLTVSGDTMIETSLVKKWAYDIKSFVKLLARKGLRLDRVQKIYDTISYSIEEKNGMHVLEKAKERLAGFFSKKEFIVKELAKKAESYHDLYRSQSPEMQTLLDASKAALMLNDIDKIYFSDADLPERFPTEMTYKSKYQRKVSMGQSMVKISDQVDRHHSTIQDTVLWSSKLDTAFKKHYADDPNVLWLYFASRFGIYRSYPGISWELNFIGFPVDFDPRVRPWYVSTISGPKDVVIILDSSLSMEGRRLQMAKAITRTVLSTLTRDDHVTVISGRASHWDRKGRWHEYTTDVLSCNEKSLLPADISHKKDLLMRLDSLQAGGTSEVQQAFTKAFQLLKHGPSKTGCQSIIIFMTDGKDSDGDEVRCNPGRYTRTGFMPGKICRYRWSKIWGRVEKLQLKMSQKTRIFSYLMDYDGEEFPGKLSCDNGGLMKKIKNTEDLISQMNEYYHFLTSNTIRELASVWSAPYVDGLGLGLMVTCSQPVSSRKNNETIGVIGVDVRLDDIENVLSSFMWGSVYAFLINSEGEAIFHPRLKPVAKLRHDPVFVSITDLEQIDNKPESFNKLLQKILDGKTGSYRIENAVQASMKGDFQDGIHVQYGPATYYYTSIEDSGYSFAIRVNDEDLIHRRPVPLNMTPKILNIYGNIITYSMADFKREFPDASKQVRARDDIPKYAHQLIVPDHSSVIVASRAYCDPALYLQEDDLKAAVRAHAFLNSERNVSMDDKRECVKGKIFRNAVKDDVLITEMMEDIWRTRTEEIADIKWTFIGTQSGVFRTFPAHTSRKDFDPTRRPWYHRATVNPEQVAVSSPYMDSSGLGKVITISAAIMQRIPTDVPMNVSNCPSHDQNPIGCQCKSSVDCESRVCRHGIQTNQMRVKRCHPNKVEAVSGLDIWYDDFHRQVFDLMKTNDGKNACTRKYLCPDGIHQCETRCYLVDHQSNLVLHQDFLSINHLREQEYNRVSLGDREGDIMKKLIYKYNFYERTKNVDFQGTCLISDIDNTVRMNESELREGSRSGPIPPFSNKYSCAQEVLGYTVNKYHSMMSEQVIHDTVGGPCGSGDLFLAPLQKMNLFLLVIANYSTYKESLFFNFNCHMSNAVFGTGSFKVTNGTCQHVGRKLKRPKRHKCPKLKGLQLNCTYNTGSKPSSAFDIWHSFFALICISVMI